MASASSARASPWFSHSPSACLYTAWSYMLFRSRAACAIAVAASLKRKSFSPTKLVIPLSCAVTTTFVPSLGRVKITGFLSMMRNAGRLRIFTLSKLPSDRQVLDTLEFRYDGPLIPRIIDLLKSRILGVATLWALLDFRIFLSLIFCSHWMLNVFKISWTAQITACLYVCLLVVFVLWQTWMWIDFLFDTEVAAWSRIGVFSTAATYLNQSFKFVLLDFFRALVSIMKRLSLIEVRWTREVVIGLALWVLPWWYNISCVVLPVQIWRGSPVLAIQMPVLIVLGIIWRHLILGRWQGSVIIFYARYFSSKLSSWQYWLLRLWTFIASLLFY